MAYSLRLREWVGSLTWWLPGECALCRSVVRGGLLCDICAGEVSHSMATPARRCPRCCLRLDARGHCHDCAALVPVFGEVFAAVDYAFPANLLLLQFKQQRRFVLAKTLAAFMADCMRDTRYVLPDDTILVPVPATKASLQRRGFNPAAELAGQLARQLGLGCHHHWLYRHHETGPQKLLNRQQRLAGTAGLFGCSSKVAGHRFAVIDDVMTTGSTLNAASRVLLAAGATAVTGIVLARTPVRERLNDALSR